jgi:dienelactone hydrolase
MRATIRIHWFSLGIAFVAASGCGLSAPQVGQVVSAGVAKADFETRLNSTDVVKVHVLFPSDEAGAPLPGPHPAVVFIQGGFVAPGRYQWQGEALAKQGYVVALPEHFLDLAFFGADVGEAARQLLVQPPRGSVLTGLVDSGRVGVAGHSLGGVVAMKLALNGQFGAVALEASFPDTADVPLLPAFTKPSLSLAGEKDCSAKLDTVKAGWAQLTSPTALLVLAGVTHYQFTDAQTEDVKRNCLPDGPIDDAHARIAAALVSFFDHALGAGGHIDPATLGQVPGSTLEVR